jgi:uncharacterized membrane protein
MKILKPLTIISFGLNLLLVFLAIFDNNITIPSWFVPFGRLHPVILHIPIGILVFVGIFYFFKKQFETNSFAFLFHLSLVFLSFFTALAAIMGLVLSNEGSETSSNINWHKWTGVAFSVSCYLALEYQNFVLTKKNFQLYFISSITVLMLWVGHLGGSITHGENFVFENKTEISDKKQTVYEVFVKPIMDQKCKSCHNDQKTKGKLNMTTIEKMLVGGKNGPIWIAGDTINSHLTKRLNLPVDAKEHMPPKGKAQLTLGEIMILKNWIFEGANTKTILNHIAANSYFKKIVKTTAIQEIKTYQFGSASENTITKINSPYCIVSPLNSNSPALKVDFFVSSKYDKKSFESLNNVKEQIVSLNMAKMPINDEIFKSISQFKNIEYLNLNQTNITGKGIEALLNCKNLNEFAISNTKIEPQYLEKLFKLPNLKKVFVWNTQIDKTQILAWKKTNANIILELGYDVASDKVIQINAPTLVNETNIAKDNEKVVFKHSLNNVNIKYTLDGSKPDSIKSVSYINPIEISKFTQIKLLATKPGWLASKTVEFTFFKSNFKAKSATMLKKIDTKYPGNGNLTLLDLKQGDITNLTDKNWLAFRDNNMEAIIKLTKPENLNGLTLSYAVNSDSYIMAPEWAELYISQDDKNYKFIKKISFNDPIKTDLNGKKGVDFELKKQKISSVKLIVKPVAKLPNWHRGKGDKGWFFIDEVYFY